MKQISSVSGYVLELEDALVPSEDVYTALLTPNVASSLSVPSGAQLAVMQFRQGTVWVNYDTTATIPSSSTFAKAGGEPDPYVRYVGSTSTLSFISASAAIVSVCFYSK
jgi:hypothetical protein